jgi:uncharacterized protein
MRPFTAGRLRPQGSSPPTDDPGRDAGYSPWPQVVTFLLVVFALSWVPWGIVVVAGEGPNSGGVFGLLWALGGFGPVLAAVLLAARRGSPHLRSLWKRVARWRVGRWYVLLLAPALLVWTATLMAAAMDETRLVTASGLELTMVPVFILGGVVFGGLEEIGWRGYLLHALQARMSALAASLWIGLVWAAWHAPLFFMEGSLQASTPLVWFTVQASALSVLLTWAHNGAGQSVWITILLHGMVNASYSAATASSDAESIGLVMPYVTILLGVAAVGVVSRVDHQTLTGRRQGDRARPTPPLDPPV